MDHQKLRVASTEACTYEACVHPNSGVRLFTPIPMLLKRALVSSELMHNTHKAPSVQSVLKPKCGKHE